MSSRNTNQPLSTAANQPCQQQCTTTTLYKPSRNYLITGGGIISHASWTAPYFTMQEELLRFYQKIFLGKDITVQCSREYSKFWIHIDQEISCNIMMLFVMFNFNIILSSNKMMHNIRNIFYWNSSTKIIKNKDLRKFTEVELLGDLVIG